MGKTHCIELEGYAVKWLDRTLMQGPHLCLVMSEQAWKKHIGEHKPSEEFEAYSIQTISQNLMHAYGQTLIDNSQK